jgi:hypothetical protein
LEEFVGINAASGPAVHSPAPFGAGPATAGAVEPTQAGSAAAKTQAPAEKATDADDFKDF